MTSMGDQGGELIWVPLWVTFSCVPRLQGILRDPTPAQDNWTNPVGDVPIPVHKQVL